jgi:DnaJ domain
MRKAYLKLSLLVHPDKLGSNFANATKAFQALVRAFERLSMPDLAIDEDDVVSSKGEGTKKPGKTKTIARSNEGCHRTRVCCPRCKQPWSENTLDGNPDYFYNFLMCGLKQYTCSTCLLEFGCVTAIHRCPFCNKIYEYLPQVKLGSII